MHNRLFAVAVAIVICFSPAAAQDLARYRAYALDSNVAAVLASSEARADDVKVLHEKPALIQELEWRARYAAPTEAADPVRAIVFSFCDDALYQVRVTYDVDRTDGLSNADIIASLAAVYGASVPAASRNRPLDAAAETVVLAQWDRAGSSLTLLRGVYSSEFQLLLIGKASSTRARGAIREAARMEIADAPRRERQQRTQEAADAAAARDKIRLANKAAFRP